MSTDTHLQSGTKSRFKDKVPNEFQRTSSPSSSIISNSSDNSTRISLTAGMMNHLSDIRSLSPASSIASMHDVNTMSDKIKDLESEKLALMIDHNNLIKEFNKRMESHLEEIRSLKESNQNIEQEAVELRDLCCFLDDDRNKCRKLAKEWQRFGKHTVTVMRNEVISYQEKLQALEKKQVELVKENGELRDLCVYLDNQRTNDSNESALKYTLCRECASLNKEDDTDGRHNNNNAYAAEHIQRLQNKIHQLEREKESIRKLLMFGGKFSREKKRVSFSFPDDDGDSSSTTSEVDRLDYPPSFGSTESFLKSSDMGNPAAAGILRNGNLALKTPHSDSSHQTNESNDQLSELRDRLSQTNIGEGNLTQHEISLLKDICTGSTDKERSNSNASSNSFDLNSPSPISPPPSSIGVPLYKVNEQLASGEGVQYNMEKQSQHKITPPGYSETLARNTPQADSTSQYSTAENGAS